MSRRPTVEPRPWVWKEKHRKQTPGISLQHPVKGLVAHMTYTEARSFADRLHDLCDAAGNLEPPLPTTEAEQE